MSEFAKAVQQWQVFYVSVATAAATLAGLLFVALSINLGILTQQQNVHFKDTAQQAFGSFVYMLVTALIFLIPDISPETLGWALLGFGVYGTYMACRHVLTYLKNHREWGIEGRLLPSATVALARLDMLAMAVGFLFGWTAGLNGACAGMLVLMTSAARATWLLLVGLQGRDFRS